MSAAAAAAIVLLSATLYGSRAGLAQQPASPWSQPVNLSHSGSASLAYPSIDSNQALNVVWHDEFAGLMHTQRVPEGWLKPAALALPFANGLANLALRADANGLVHAAWINSLGNLYYSRVEGRFFATPSAWSASQLLGTSAIDLDLEVDPDGRLHLAYLRVTETSQASAGVYYRVKENSAVAWTSARLIYASLYYRGLEPEQAQVSVAGGQDSLVLLAWDEPPQDRLFLARSGDGGQSWEAPQEIDRRRPEDSQASSGPSNPEVATLEQLALLVWQAGHGSLECSTYYRWSGDAGKTWLESGQLPAPFNESCAVEKQLLVDARAGAIRAMLSTATASYLSAWKVEGGSERWSAPSQEAELFSFTNPENFRQVTLAKRQAVLDGNSLLVSAAEAEEGGDVWLVSRDLSQETDLAPTPESTQEWSDPVTVESGPAPYRTAELLPDGVDRLHAFWSLSGGDEIFYALWDGARWTPAIPILASAGGAPDGLSAAVHPAGLLLLGWSDPLSGELFVSQAPLNQAINPGSWSTSQAVGTGGLSSSAPQLAVTPEGGLAIAYSVPINEGRGLYLVSSAGAVQPGEPVEWQAPAMAFDAAQAGWEMVGEARLAVDPQGRAHLLWQRLALSNQESGGNLFYTQAQLHSVETPAWKAASQVSGGQCAWHELLAAADGTLHRLWQESSESGPLWHQYSPDGGASWSEAVRLTGGQAGSGRPGAGLDAQDRLHLLQLAPTFENGWNMLRWSWQGGQSWSAGASQPLEQLQAASWVGLSGTTDGGLAALINGQLKPAEPSAPAASGAFALLHTLGQPGNEQAGPVAEVTFIPAATQAAQGGTAPTPLPSPTLEFSSAPPDSASNALNPRLRSLLLGALPAVVFFVVFVVLILRRERGR